MDRETYFAFDFLSVKTSSASEGAARFFPLDMGERQGVLSTNINLNQYWYSHGKAGITASINIVEGVEDPTRPLKTKF
jgi:hypothetical protein